MSRILIALHGHLVKRSVLNAVFEYCMKMKFKVNVLLVDDEGAPPPVLMDFVARLKLAGLDGDLFRQAGCLGQAVLRHASHHKDIRMILIDSMKNWGSRVPVKALSQPVGLFSGVMS